MSHENVAASYDAVAERYAVEIGDELAGKPVDRAWLGCLTELAGDGLVADVGCGPGHVTAYLKELGLKVVGVDLSPGMVAVARDRNPELAFEVGSLVDLPVGDGEWAAAVCAYSIIHLGDEERPVAFAELRRAIAPGGWLLLSFHVGTNVEHLDEWWGHKVDIDFRDLDPDVIGAELEAAGFTVMAVTRRKPWPNVEHPSLRCHLLAQR